MAAGDVQKAIRGPEQYKYRYNGNLLTGVVDDSFTINGDDGDVVNVGRVDARAALFRVIPATEMTGSISFKAQDWEDQFQTPYRVAQLASSNQLAEAIFQLDIYDYVEGGAVGVGKARVLKSRPEVSWAWTSFILFKPKQTADGSKVDVQWRGTIQAI